MHVKVRKVKGCRRKRLKALSCSLAIDDLAWSGNPLLPIQIPNQAAIDNSDYSASYVIPDTAIFTPFTYENPTDNAPSLFDNSQVELSNVFNADLGQTLPLMQSDDPGHRLLAFQFGDLSGMLRTGGPTEGWGASAGTQGVGDFVSILNCAKLHFKMRGNSK